MQHALFVFELKLPVCAIVLFIAKVGIAWYVTGYAIAFDTTGRSPNVNGKT